MGCQNEYVYEIPFSKDVSDYMRQMKVVLVKGFGYMVVSKNTTITPERLLYLVEYFENCNIEV